MNFPSVSIAAKTRFEALFAEVAENVTVFEAGVHVYAAFAFVAILPGIVNPT
jgi:hypothetical protein